MDPSERLVVYDWLYGNVKTEVLSVCAKLGIFDVIEELGGSCTAQQLAGKLNVAESNLQRLLDMLLSGKWLECSTEDDSGEAKKYTNSLVAKNCLTSKGSNSMLNMIKFNTGAAIESAIKSLHSLVTTGTAERHGRAAQESSMPPYFLEAMEDIAQEAFPLLAKFKLGKYKAAVDLGGALGPLARALIKIYPEMKVSVVDQPKVIEHAKSMEVNVHSHVEFVAGDFFKDGLPAADLYILSHILHDWSDAECHSILTNVYKAVSPGGAILVLDKLLTRNHDGPWNALVLGLHVWGIQGGEERDESQVKALLSAVGFTDMLVHRDDRNPTYDGLLAIKPQ